MAEIWRDMDLLVANLGRVLARRDDRRLVEQVCERRAREAGGPLGDDVEVELRGERLAAGVHLVGFGYRVG